MLLVRISPMRGKTGGSGRKIGAFVYRTLAERLHLSVRMEDVFIRLEEVKKDDWSFGNSGAQYAE